MHVCVCVCVCVNEYIYTHKHIYSDCNRKKEDVIRSQTHSAKRGFLTGGKPKSKPNVLSPENILSFIDE